MQAEVGTLQICGRLKAIALVLQNTDFISLFQLNRKNAPEQMIRSVDCCCGVL